MIEHAKPLFESAGLELRPEELAILQKTPQAQIAAAAAVFSLYSARLVERALEGHARALLASAEAANEHTAGLKRATWCLVAATLILVAVTVAIGL